MVTPLEGAGPSNGTDLVPDSCGQEIKELQVATLDHSNKSAICAFHRHIQFGPSLNTGVIFQRDLRKAPRKFTHLETWFL